MAVVQDLKKRVALITGITGQDGSYLAESASSGITSTASSGARRPSTPGASTIFMRIRMRGTCRSCTTAT